jgi:hypothetical protein
MRNDTHDNELDNFDPWSSLGLQTAMILNRLQIKARLLELQTETPKKGVDNDKPETDRTTGDDKEEQRRFVEMRLRELADFERPGKGI